MYVIPCNLQEIVHLLYFLSMFLKFIPNVSLFLYVFFIILLFNIFIFNMFCQCVLNVC